MMPAGDAFRDFTRTVSAGPRRAIPHGPVAQRGAFRGKGLVTCCVFA